MRILIAGGGGFVGGELARLLAGHELIIPARDPARLLAAGLRGEFPPFDEDLERLTIRARPGAVINLLGIIRETDGATFERVHVEYTRRLLAGARGAGAEKFVQMSALGAAPDSASAYYRSKFAAEEAVRASGLAYAILRPSFISGPGQKLRAQLRALARFAPVFAAPSDARVAPVEAEAVAECLKRAALDAGIRDETFELAGETAMPFSELLARELAAAGLRRPVLGLPRVLFRPLLPLFALFNTPPMTWEQYLMLAVPNVPSGKYRGVKELLAGKMV